jgi:hypothetical protein
MSDKLKMKTGTKVINWILFVIFLLFALVQLNDPDPLIWFVTYFIVALFAILSNFIRIPKWYYYLAVAGLVIFALFHANYFMEWIITENKGELFGEMVYEKPYIEGTREFMGLVLALMAIIYLLRKTLRLGHPKM